MVPLLHLFLLAAVSGLPDTINIGGLFHSTETLEELVFQYTTQTINSEGMILHKTLVALPKRVPPNDSLVASSIVCHLLEQRVVGIFGPRAGPTSPLVQSMCDTKDIPHVETSWDTKQRRQDFLVNLHPHPSTLTRLYMDLVSAWGWKKFTLLYEDASGLVRLSSLLTMFDKKDNPVTLRQLATHKNHRQILRDMRHAGERNIILDCSIETLPEVLKQAQQVGLMTSDQSYIITSLDLHTIDLEPYQHGGTNITGLRMVDPNSTIVEMAVKRWADLELRKGKNLGISPQTLTVSMALIHDAVQLFAHALRRLDFRAVNMRPLDCESQDSWGHGASLINFMKDGQSMLRGLTGMVQFDNEGFRTNIMLDIMELSYKGLQRVGTWNSSGKLNITRLVPPTSVHDSESLHNRTFRVLTALSHPYGMLRESTVALKGNDQYEGFGIELIHELSLMLGFNYTFELQLDNVYGSYNNKTKQWTGMIQQLLKEEADLAITDLTITSDREAAVDFTTPFMSLGISILYKRPTEEAPDLFSFMAPLSTDVWICMFSVYMGVSILLWIMGRICPYEWNNPYPCIEEPEELENQFTLQNSLWFTIGSLMQQGSEIAPIAVSTRMVAGIWWFFTLIMVSSYTANLAAFLTVESTTSPFKNVRELANQNVIKYGAKIGGSTVNFFRDSADKMYRDMYKKMIEEPGVLASSNNEGLKWVKERNYAYFMESTSIQYITERDCEVAQVGELLDTKGYGIAMRKDSSYRNQLSSAVLKLQESGKLAKMKNRWWKEERGGGRCADNVSSGNPSPLNLLNVGGVFVVLLGGLVLSCFVALYELLCKVHETSRREKVPFLEELMAEFRFIARCHGSTKPIRKYNSQEKEDSPPTGEGTGPQNFVRMSIYGDTPYGFNTNMKVPLT